MKNIPKSKIDTLEVPQEEQSKNSDYIQVSLPKLKFSEMNLTFTHFLVGLLIVASFLLGMLTMKVQYLEKSSGATSAQAAAATGNTQPQTPPEDTGPVKVSIDDDPMMGDKNAPVTMVDFSDYECPFCKRYFDETFAQIKKDYIDTGKVKYVYRDLPLAFHDPMATLEAVAANCAREQGDDSTYFKYHDEIFKRTKSNGNGLSEDDLYTIASDLGLNPDSFSTCVTSDRFNDEVQKDLADASLYGATGTPTFFIGKSDSSGTFTGTKLVGAQPYSAFKTIIDEQLK